MSRARQATLPGLAPAAPRPRKPSTRQRLAELLGDRWEVLASSASAPRARLALLVAWDDFAYVFDAQLTGRGWSLWDGRGDTVGHGFDLEGLAAALRRFVGEEDEAEPAAEPAAFDLETFARRPAR